MRTFLLLACLGAACAFSNIDDKIVSGYGAMAVMRDCFGAPAYKNYMRKMKKALTTCRHQPFPQEPTTATAGSEAAPNTTDIMFDRAHVHEISIKMRMLVSNSSCVLQQLGYIDDSYNILYENMIAEVKEVGQIDKQLMEDLLEAITKCKDFTTCVPTDQIQYPMGPVTLRYLNFSICRNQATLAACLKKEFRDEEPDYDYVGPNNDIDTTSVDDKIVSMLWKNKHMGLF